MSKEILDWVGPITVEMLLDHAFKKSIPSPPEANSVYLVSINRWRKEPKSKSQPIYVGSNTGQSARFRTRVGDLIADAFGFYSEETGHHSGGQSIHEFCLEQGINPRTLMIGWLGKCECMRCAENYIYGLFRDQMLNKNRPSKCEIHPSNIYGDTK